ncbi:MAG: 23S rRNA (uracil(1939)-C(5))-methyltransferase RlmD [Tissierellales bacterium]|jgi:23S rRNA (uracil1939-C5)-methyltransferase|nr:23S rRNA (uracil(1939)-C(5))-methyltransferase RlmD [Tissierellales bacterium]
MKRPVNKQEIYTLDIVDLSHQATGVAKKDNYTIFVEGAIPGDRVEAKIIKAKKNYAVARCMKIVEPSKHRREPICPIANICGGCQIMNIDYAEQLRLKKERVKQELRRNNLEHIEVLDTLGMAEPYYYRNKAQFPVGERKGKLEIGFYKPQSHDIVDTKHCYIQHEINDKIIDIIRFFMEMYQIPAYDEVHQRGLVRHIITKTSFKTRDVMLILVINGSELPHSEELIDLLTQRVEQIKSIQININEKNTNVILGNKTVKIYGEDQLIDYIGDLSFVISPESFFQVNPLQTEVLYQKALEKAGLTGEETVYDLYCGIGSISLFLAQKAKKVYGIEVVKQAIENARENARRNGIENAEFYLGTAEEVFPKLYKEGKKADVVVVDPPRKGCDEAVLDTIVEMNPEKVVYVSCNPASLARDIAYLMEKGYVAEEIQPVDMFPHSLHVETVVKLQRKNH